MALKERTLRIMTNPKFLLGFYILFTIAASLLEYLKGAKADTQTHYNNFMIFSGAYENLMENRDLYVAHPEQYYDLFKYSPAFAFFFGLFTLMPILLGLICWNLFNSLVLFSAINSIKRFSQNQKAFALLFIVVELITSIQSSQSNALIAGLMIWAYNAFENERIGRAALFIAFATFIKPFALVGAALFLFYPKKGSFILNMIGYYAALAFFPFLIARGVDLQYQSWLRMLQADAADSIGMSVAGWIESWFKYSANKMLVTLGGIVLFCTAYLNRKAWNEAGFKILLLASALIWIVIFNHKAESPTFVIAVCGVALWFYAQKPSIINILLLALVFIFTCLSPTDLFPPDLRASYVMPYQLKVFPCILVWFKILYDQICYKPLNFVTG